MWSCLILNNIRLFSILKYMGFLVPVTVLVLVYGSFIGPALVSNHSPVLVPVLVPVLDPVLVPVPEVTSEGPL